MSGGVYLYILCSGSVRDPLRRSFHPIILERGWVAFWAAARPNIAKAREWCRANGYTFKGVIAQSVLGQSASPKGQLEWDALARVQRMASRGRLPSHVASVADLRRGLTEFRGGLMPGAGETLCAYAGALDLVGDLYEMSVADSRRGIELQHNWALGVVDWLAWDSAGDRELFVRSGSDGDVREERSRAAVAVDWTIEKFGRAGIEPCASSKVGADWLAEFSVPPRPSEVVAAMVNGGPEPAPATSPLCVMQLQQTYRKIGASQGGADSNGYQSRSVGEVRASGAEFIVLGQAGGEELEKWHREDGVSIAVGLDMVGGRIG